MIWLSGTTDNSAYFAESLEIQGIESRLTKIKYVNYRTVLLKTEFANVNNGNSKILQGTPV